MKMVSMKMKPEENGEHGTIDAPEGSQEKYPWGLRINLGDEELKKLGINELPKVGEKLPLMAMVSVVGVRSNESQNGETRNVELQITECAMEMKKPMDNEKTASKLYGGEGSM